MRSNLRRQRLRSFSGVLLLGIIGILQFGFLCSACVANTEQTQGQTQEPEKIAPEIAKEWETAGAEVGWVNPRELSPFGGFVFYTAKQEPAKGWLPAFRFREITKPGLSALPHPVVPFALTVSNTDFGNAELKSVTQFRKLASLDLTNSKINDEGLAPLSKLENLKALSVNLGFVNVSDEGLKVLSKLTNLTALDLGSTLASDSALTAVGEMKNLQSLRLSNTQITKKGLAVLSKLKQLATLDISSNEVSLEWLAQVAKCSQLSSLNLGATEVGAAELKPLVKLRTLKTLDLGATKLTDAGLETLGKMKQLRNLNVANTSLTENGQDSLRRSLPECKIAF